VPEIGGDWGKVRLDDAAPYKGRGMAPARY
jgi:hypothetical protein